MPIIRSSRVYVRVITACGVQCLGCWLLEVRCRTAGYASGMADVARLVAPVAGSLEAAEPLPGYRHCNGCIIPQAVTHSLVLLKMGGINARNMFR
jgi:hypothetical protein